MREFNNRDESDPTYKPDTFEIVDDEEALIYQIKMTLGTDNGEVLGEPEFGCSLEGLLFTSEFYMVGFSQVVSDQISKFSELAQVYPVSVDMKQIPISTYRSAAIIDVAIQGKSKFGILLGED